MRSFHALLLLCVASSLIAGGDGLPMGARSAGMGYTGLTLQDLWGLRLNPAGIAGLEAPMAGAFHQSHFLSEELSDQGLAFVLPVGNGAFGFAADRFGYSLYNESRASIAYAMRFGDGLRAAIQLNRLGVRLAENYGRTSTMIAEIGMQARLTEALWMGAHIYNPNRSKLGGPYDDRVPTLLRAGITYIFSEQLLMNMDVEKDMDRDERYRAGLEYAPNRALFLRTGISSGPVQAHFGVGIKLKRLDLDIAMAVRSKLGPTPMFGVNYRFK